MASYGNKVRTRRFALCDWRSAVVSGLVRPLLRALVRVPRTKKKERDMAHQHHDGDDGDGGDNDTDDGSTSAATTITKITTPAATGSAAATAAATTAAAAATAGTATTASTAAACCPVSGAVSVGEGRGVMGTAISVAKEKPAPPSRGAEGSGGGPWEINLCIPFEDISGVRPLAEGTACR